MHGGGGGSDMAMCTHTHLFADIAHLHYGISHRECKSLARATPRVNIVVWVRVCKTVHVPFRTGR